MVAEPDPSFAKLLLQQRRKAGLTQEELAQQARLGARSISDLERGISTAPHRDTVALLAEALKLTEAARTAFEIAAQTGRAKLVANRPHLPVRLPTLATPLIGRATELAELRAVLHQPDIRLVTLTGPPGIGKTSLAIHVAAEIATDPAQTVAFAALAAITERDLVLREAARALGLVNDGGQPVTTVLTHHLRNRRALLVLDNLEQVLGAAPDLHAIIAECPQLTMLVTSRAILNLRHECEFPVPALAVAGVASDQAGERHAPAIQLFAQRARTVRPGFELTDSVAPMVAKICSRLDGVPLAIELAAARIRVLSPAQLLRRLDRSLDLLVGGPQDLPPRHRTLRAAIAWSYDLLDTNAKALFRRLGVFAGGWTLEAAEFTCDVACVLDGLTTLVEQNLVRRDVDDAEGERFELLETLRDFARERLDEAGEGQTQRARHASYFADFAATAESELTGPRQGAWLIQLERDHDNIRAALRWARSVRDVELGLRLAGKMWRFWEAHGHVAEGDVWLEEFLAEDESLPGTRNADRNAARADALHAAGTMALRLADYPRSRVRMQECLSLRQLLGDNLGWIVALNGLANVAVYQGDYPQARSRYLDALAIARRAGAKRHIAALLSNLAVVANDCGEYAEAEELGREALEIRREQADMSSIAGSLNVLGDTKALRGEFAEAEQCLQECVSIYRRLGSPVGVAYAVLSTGEIALHQAEPYRARDLAEESLAVFRSAGDRRGHAMSLRLLAEAALAVDDRPAALLYAEQALALFIAANDRLGVINVLETRARLALADDEPRWAARLFGLAANLREALGSPVPAVARAAYERDIEILGGRAAIMTAVRDPRAARGLPPDPVDATALSPVLAAGPAG